MGICFRSRTDGDRFCQVARLIDIQALGAADIVGQQLQRNDRQAGGKMRISLGHIDGETGGVLDAVVAVGG